MLLRHWTLYDSILHSNYMASRMKLWKEQGKRELDKFITHLGITNKEARQTFKYLTVSTACNSQSKG